MYDQSKNFTINIFKDKSLWLDLEKYNQEIIDFSKNVICDPNNNYDVNKGQCSDWFDPDKIKLTPIYPNEFYPNPHPCQLDPKFNLVMHSANYFSLFLIYCLYENKKNILIEDICCGISHMSYYLSKLGFKYFNFVDNFTQMPKQLLIDFISKTTAFYTINFLTAPSVVSNLVAYPLYCKRINSNDEAYLYNILEPPPDKHYISQTIELFISYYPTTDLRSLSGLDRIKFFNEEKFIPLCTDIDNMCHACCRENKYDEFREKLSKFII
jgi:hypothetical protein